MNRDLPPMYQSGPLRSRIEAAQQAEHIRSESLAAARRVRRKYPLRSEAELMRELESLYASIPANSGMDEWRDRLSDITADMENAMQPAPVLADIPQLRTL